MKCDPDVNRADDEIDEYGKKTGKTKLSRKQRAIKTREGEFHKESLRVQKACALVVRKVWKFRFWLDKFFLEKFQFPFFSIFAVEKLQFSRFPICSFPDGRVNGRQGRRTRTPFSRQSRNRSRKRRRRRSRKSSSRKPLLRRFNFRALWNQVRITVVENHPEL